MIRLFTLQPCCFVLDHQSPRPPACGCTVVSRLVGSQVYPLDSRTGIVSLPNPCVPRFTWEVTKIPNPFMRLNVFHNPGHGWLLSLFSPEPVMLTAQEYHDYVHSTQTNRLQTRTSQPNFAIEKVKRTPYTFMKTLSNSDECTYHIYFTNS